jgi:hypothetical protein
MWYQLGVRQGEARSKVNLGRLLTRLSADEISRGELRLKEFRPTTDEFLNAVSGATERQPSKVRPEF